jgi:hypothetical protein
MTVGVKLPSDFIVLDPVKEEARKQETMLRVYKVLNDPFFYLTFLLPIFLFMRFLRLWKEYGDDESLTTAVAYDIPVDIDPALA